MANLLALAGPDSKYSFRMRGAPAFGRVCGMELTAPRVFWISLFAPNIRVYETQNSGRWYDFGFLLGVGGWASHTETRKVIEKISFN